MSGQEAAENLLRLSSEPFWWHEAHGLHDDPHHQAHRPLDACVPLRMVTPDGDLVAAVSDRSDLDRERDEAEQNGSMDRGTDG